ncbi:MAG: transporter, family, beta-lactamase induction signal transducer AmpG [Anaerophaga sp.]|uniref:MFS transporter n=1 Tax=Anaerophaga thermohalophila TaxID=177400 RepID=UPI000237C223|nr:MFS transporter [Anaerophaga thermohalophila]MDK2840866.1 transporter, family, beta-lactamase induction signal transducer AmpG [Anaerophaga sp.]MDN5291026.1 transporter, family, beta-lactamase induction signal transducer AmpG [Anaerophaga sp.]
MGSKNRSPWSWVPTLYFAEGIPYVIVMTVSVIMYKRLGISNADIALYTSWLYLPWVIKPLWSPVVDLLKTKRWWIIMMQLLVGAGLAGVAFTIPVPDFFQYTLAFFWLLAFSSATHDIAADGFYMLALDEHKQAYFIGIRSTFYRVAMITGQGLLIILAGFFETYTGLDPVEFNVYARPDLPAKIEIPEFKRSVESDEMAFVLTNEEIHIPTQKVSPEIIDSIKQWAVNQNLKNGFVIPEAKKETKAETGWFATHVSGPLKEKLRAAFGRDDVVETSLRPGNIGLVGVRLTRSPEEEEEVALNTGIRRGDESIKLIEGERIVVDKSNWQKTAWIVIQLDPKLEEHSSAYYEGRSGNIPLAWMITFFILAGLFLIFFVYHRFILPRPDSDKAVVQGDGENMFTEFFATFKSFFVKENIGPALAFLLLFRLGESQIVKLASPFMLDPREIGGLGLTTGDVGLIYGTIGILALTLGGILGGLLASKHGLKYWIWPMAFAMNIPNVVFVYLSYVTPQSMWLISGAVALEQFGYGFGFTAYMLYMIYFSDGSHKTAHYAICTGLMALGMMIPGMISGWIQEIVGYQNFFIWVLICTIPGFIIIKFLKIDPTFGIKKKNEEQ